MENQSPTRIEQSLSEAHRFAAQAMYWLGLMLVKRIIKKSWIVNAKANLRAALKELE
jgi:hypothetical protein